MKKLDYKLKYILHIFIVSFSAISLAILAMSFVDMARTKTLLVEFDISISSLLIALIGISVYSVFMGMACALMFAKLTTVSFTFSSPNNKIYKIDKVDSFILNYKAGNAQRKIKTVKDNETKYTTGNKYLDWLTEPVVVTDKGNILVISGPKWYIEKINKL